MNSRRVAGWVVACLLAWTAVGPSLASDEPYTEVRVFRTQHLDSTSTVTLLRSIFQTQQIFQASATGPVIARDEPRSLDAADKLLRELDVLPPRWLVDLVVSIGAGETVIRSMDLAEHLELSYGSDSGSRLKVSVSPGVATGTTLPLAYDIDVRVRVPGSAPFGFRQSGSTQLGDGGRLVILEPAAEPLRATLRRTLGTDDTPTAVFLRFRRED